MDSQSSGGEIVYDFTEADKQLGYWKTVPELRSALNIFGKRVAGLGYEVDNRTREQLEFLTGWGKDTFSSTMQMMVIECLLFGDSFAEIVRESGDGIIINIKKLYPGDMRIVMGENGLIKRYEQVSNIPGQKPKKFSTEKIFHLSNERIGNEMHGTSIIESLKIYLDAYYQALNDEITIRHRDKALGIVYYKTDDTGQIIFANSQIAKAVNKGEMLGLPEDTAKIEPFPSKSPGDRINYLQFIVNQFYSVVGTPKVLVTSEGFTEAGGKAGLIAFEPNEIAGKLKLEEDIKNQLGLTVKFVGSPSILGNEQQTQQKNSGQTSIQPNETEVRPTRTE
jgi:hypothetical protein